MKCQMCGKENDRDSKYCVDCGALLAEQREQKESYQIEEAPEKSYNPREAYAKPAMILGLVSLGAGIICCLGPLSIIVSIICGVLAIVFSILAMKTPQKGKAITGLVCGLFGIIFGLIILAVYIVFYNPEAMAYIEEHFPEIWQAIQDALQQVEQG